MLSPDNSSLRNRHSSQPDLLAHKYRPKEIDDILCHKTQAVELKLWLEEFLRKSNKRDDDSGDNLISRNEPKKCGSNNKIYSEDSYSCSMTATESMPSCILVSGPPGIGKTSMVYAIANQLNLHVVECHASEKRDSKSISRLKLANQKQHINRQVPTCQGSINNFFNINGLNSNGNHTKIDVTTNHGSFGYNEDDNSDEKDDSCLLIDSGYKKSSNGTPVPLGKKTRSRKSTPNTRNKKSQKKFSNNTQRSMFDFIQKDSPSKQDIDTTINKTINILSDDELEIVEEKTNSRRSSKSTYEDKSKVIHNGIQPTHRKLTRLFTTFGDTATNFQPSKSLSVSTTSSIILFDDIDVLFEDDGQFWTSLIPFIETSQRPVIMTATQSIDKIKELIPRCQIISLGRPDRNKLSELLLKVCRGEGFYNNEFLHRNEENCDQLIFNYPCDIRQCLNQVHFYRGLRGPNSESDVTSIHPAFHCFDLDQERTCATSRLNNKSLATLYDSIIFADIIKSQIEPIDKNSLVQSWVDGKPTSFRGEEYNYLTELGQDIQSTIIDLSRNIFKDKLLDYGKYRASQELYQEVRSRTNRAYELLDTSIKGRVESYEVEFKTDIAPFLASIIQSEQLRNQLNSTVNARRIKRFLHYLDTIQVYLDDKGMLADIITNYGVTSTMDSDILLAPRIESHVMNDDVNHDTNSIDNDDTREYYHTIDSDTEEIPIYNARKRLKIIDDDDTC